MGTLRKATKKSPALGNDLNHYWFATRWGSPIMQRSSISAPGHDHERAWLLAEQNLGNRETDRQVALAVKAAEATGRFQEACDLLRNHGPLVQVYLQSLERVLTQ